MPDIGVNAVEYALRYGTKLMDIAQDFEGVRQKTVVLIPHGPP